MSKIPQKGKPRGVSRRAGIALPSEADFDEVLRLIDDARMHALGAVNTMLIQLHWCLASTSAGGSPPTGGDKAP